MTLYMATGVWINNAWRHQTITWTNIDKSSARSNYINLRTISQDIYQSSITNINLYITSQKIIQTSQGPMSQGSWIPLWLQVLVGWSISTPWPRMSFETIVNRSQVTLEISISCKLLPSQTGNLRRSRPSRGSVGNRSQSITGQSEVGRKCITAVGSWLWFWGPSLCR